MSDDFTLCYWIRGQPLSAVSAIQISRTAIVAKLHTLLKEEHPIIFRDVDVADLQVYKLKDPIAEPYEENLKSVVLSECGGALRRLRKLSDLFVSEAPPPEECIHVIVDAPYPEVTCWMRGGKTDESISISIKANVSVNQLHARIKEAHEALRRVATEHIRLYRVSRSVLRETLDKMDDGARLNGTCVLYDAFLDLPVLEPYCVVVQISVPTSKPLPKVDQVRVGREAFIAAYPPGTWLV